MPRGEFTAIYVHAGDWWAAKVAEVPGVNSQGRTLEEARENLQDALTQMLEILEEEADQFGDGAEVVKETERAREASSRPWMRGAKGSGRAHLLQEPG